MSAGGQPALRGPRLLVGTPGPAGVPGTTEGCSSSVCRGLVPGSVVVLPLLGPVLSGLACSCSFLVNFFSPSSAS